jgi:hypothetical protein
MVHILTQYLSQQCHEEGVGLIPTMPLFYHATLEKPFARLKSHGMILKRQFPEEIDKNVF